MGWFGIVVLNVLFGLTNWFKDRKLLSFFKEFITALIVFVFLKLIFLYIVIPDMSNKIQLLIFVGSVALVTIVLSIRTFKWR